MSHIAYPESKAILFFLDETAAAVAVCSGALMRKFSFGDEEKIRTGRIIFFRT